MSKKYNVAVVGANGAVGEEILSILHEVNFPINKLVPLASSRSAGKTVEYAGRDVVIKELTDTVFEEEDVEIALFSAGGSVSAQFAPSAVRAGAVVIDNTSHFRMDEHIPLVVPEVNPEDIAKWKTSVNNDLIPIPIVAEKSLSRNRIACLRHRLAGLRQSPLRRGEHFRRTSARHTPRARSHFKSLPRFNGKHAIGDSANTFQKT